MVNVQNYSVRLRKRERPITGSRQQRGCPINRRGLPEEVSSKSDTHCADQSELNNIRSKHSHVTTEQNIKIPNNCDTDRHKRGLFWFEPERHTSNLAENEQL